MARSMIAGASASSVWSPNSIPRRHRGLTWTPVRPKL